MRQVARQAGVTAKIKFAAPERVLDGTAATTLAITACVISAVAGSAESAAPIANASYLPLAIMSGIFDPTFPVPHWRSAAVGLFPAARAPATDLLVLLAWTAGACALVTWRFRWH